MPARARGLGLIVAALLALAAPQAAFAHATLTTTTPPDGAVLKRSPAHVELRFDEAVSAPFGAVRVIDGNGNRLDAGATSRPNDRTIVVALPNALPRGTYTIAWRVISADTHPVHGAFAFSVGAVEPNAAAVAAEAVAGEVTARSTSIGFGIVRFLRFAFVLLAAGGAFMLAYARLGSGRRFVAAAGVALVPVALLGLVYQGATAGGFTLADAAHPSVVRTVADTRFGVVWLLQAALGVVLAVLVLSRRLREAAVVGVVLAAATTAASHASTAGPLAFVADSVHVVAASAWVGGLAIVVLALAAARGRRWELAADLVPRFSRVAVVAVAVLVVAGSVSGFLEVRSWHALWTTTYGTLLWVKVALVLPLLALGAVNNRLSAPQLRAHVPQARRRFVLASAAELALFVVVLSVTAALVEQPPAKAQAGRGGPYSTTAKLGPYELDLTVDPAQTGKNEIHLYVLTRTGWPARVEELSLFASLPSAGIGPFQFTAAPAGAGHYVSPGADLPVAGIWRLRVEVRRDEFDQFEATASVPIERRAP
jgi:copper transport protein